MHVKKGLGVAAVIALAAAAGCKSGTESKAPGPAATLVASSDTVRSGGVTTALQDSLVVQVLDSDGRAVPSVTVLWTQSSGRLSAQETLTDSKGRARVSWTLGERSGNQLAVASTVTTEGRKTVAFRAAVAAGATASVQVSPSSAVVPLDSTVQLTARRADTYGNEVTDRLIAWTSSNPAIARVDAQTGRVTGVTAGTATITATSDNKSGSAAITVAKPASGTDTFDANTVDQYFESADRPATWAIAGGVLTGSGFGLQSHFIRRDVAFRDGWVEAEMDRADEGGLVIRYRDAGNLYLLAIRDNGSILASRTVEIFKRTNGQFILLQYGVPVNWPRGEVRTIRFEAVGSELRGYVNGSLVIEAKDSSITDGGIGVRYNDVPETTTTDVARYLTLRWLGN